MKKLIDFHEVEKIFKSHIVNIDSEQTPTWGYSKTSIKKRLKDLLDKIAMLEEQDDS